jgi:predicted thioesterase
MRPLPNLDVCGAELAPPHIPSAPWECVRRPHSTDIPHRDLDGTSWFDPPLEITVGMRWINTHRVNRQDLATVQYPDVDKVPVLSSCSLLGLAEHAAMQAMGGCALGGEMHIYHRRSTVLGAVIHITAECTAVDGRDVTWHVTLVDRWELIGEAELHFTLADKARYIARRVTPKLEALRTDCPPR